MRQWLVWLLGSLGGVTRYPVRGLVEGVYNINQLSIVGYVDTPAKN